MSNACKTGKTGKYIRSDKHKKILSQIGIERFKNPKEKERYRLAATGNKNPNWHGGKYHEEYGRGFGDLLKEKIRSRDLYKCQNCGLKQVDNGRQLDVHHIDYNKKNHNKDNLISLCKKCHMKTSFKRKYWIIKFRAIMKLKIMKRGE